jgi:hypothetical protein
MGTLTPSRCWAQREVRVRTAKESERASEGHLPAVEHGGRHESGKQQKSSELGPLTSCTTQTEGYISTSEELRLAKGTHELPSLEGWIGQDGERKTKNEGHSRSVEHSGGTSTSKHN